jgi:hypothetical protein
MRDGFLSRELEATGTLGNLDSGSSAKDSKKESVPMKFIVSWTIPKSCVTSAEARFLSTGAPPPDGVKMLGRWHGVGGAGVLIAETNDAKALFSWIGFWNDLLEFTVTPCVEDSEAGEAMAAMKR